MFPASCYELCLFLRNWTRNLWHTGNYWLNWAKKQHGTSFDNILSLKFPKFLNLLGSCPIQMCSLEIRSPVMDLQRSITVPQQAVKWNTSRCIKGVIRGFLIHHTTKGVIQGSPFITLCLRSIEMTSIVFTSLKWNGSQRLQQSISRCFLLLAKISKTVVGDGALGWAFC